MSAVQQMMASPSRWLPTPPLRAAQASGLFVMVFLLWRSTCVAQSNDVYSFWTSASTPLSGYRVAVVSASPIWMIGSGQHRFGIEECHYWTDSAGRPIPWPASRVKQPGDKQHYYTRFQFGLASISIRLSPIGIAFCVGLVVLVFLSISIARFTGMRWRTSGEPSRP